MPLQQSFANGPCRITFAAWRCIPPCGSRRVFGNIWNWKEPLRLFVGKEFFVVLINPFDGSRVVRRQNPLLEAEPHQVIVFAFGSRAICGLVGAEVINHFGQLLLGLLIVGHIFPLLCESTDRKNGRSETRHAVKTGQTG